MRWVLLLVGLLLADAALLFLWIAGTMPENCEAAGSNCWEFAQEMAPYSVYAFFVAFAITLVAFVLIIARAGVRLARRARQND